MLYNEELDPESADIAMATASPREINALLQAINEHGYHYRVVYRGSNEQEAASRKGNCYDNAYMEPFFSSLKRELVHGERYRTRDEAKLSIFEYVEVFYNRIRKHSGLGYKSPEQYEKSLKET